MSEGATPEAHARAMACRPGCGACCIVPSLSSSIPGMPGGKAAGVRCSELTPDNRCSIFGRPERPAVCTSYRPSEEFCGATSEDAFRLLGELERATGSGGTARQPETEE